MFMGTPHQGVGIAVHGRTVVKVASMFMPAHDRLLRHLKRDSELLQQQLGQYCPISHIVHLYAYEELKTETMLGYSILVCSCFF
jgi:hypothetical protein